MKRIRSLAIAITAIALSAGAVLAGHPTQTPASPAAAAAGLARATAASGHVVPVLAAAAADEQAEASETAQTPNVEQDTGQPTDNHGATVSAAAKGPTPTTGNWANHGAYVSSIAKANAGQTIAATKTAGHKPTTPGKPSTVPPSH